MAFLAARAHPSSDDAGFTPLHHAVLHGHVRLIPVLVSHGADADAQDNLGRTPLHLAASSGRAGAALALIRAGAAVDGPAGAAAATPLMVAAEEGRTNVVRMLLNHGARPGPLAPAN